MLKIKYIFLTLIVLVVVLPILILLILINYIIRSVVLLWSKCFRRDLVHLVPPRSAKLTLDYLTGHPNSNIVITCALKPINQVHILPQESLESDQNIQISVEDLRNLFLEKVINATIKSPAGSKEIHLYPQLKQYFVQWAGFSWMKYEDNFDIREHIKAINYRDILLEDFKGQVLLKDIQNVLCEEPWTDGKSPWEILLVEFESKNLFILKTHHAFSDGFSILNMLIKCTAEGIEPQITCESPKTCKKSSIKPRNIFTRVIRWIFCPIISVYELISLMSQTSQPQNNPWRVDKPLYQNKFITTTLPPVKLSDLKKIKTQLDVRLSSLLLAIISGAIRKSLIEKIEDLNGVNCEESKLPDNCQAVLPWPITRKKDKLENRMSFVQINLPIGENDRFSRLKMIQKQNNEIARSFVPYLNFILFNVSGILMNWILRRLSSGDPTCLISSFPGPSQELTVFNHKIQDIYFQVGIAGGTIGTGFLILSYNDQLYTTLLLDKGLVNQINSKQNGDLEIQNLGENILTEIEEFKLLANTYCNSKLPEY